MSNTKKLFDTSSLGFRYSVIVAILTAFASMGVVFSKGPADLAGSIETSLGAGGLYAVIGVLISSVLFPIVNFFTAGGKFSWAVFKKGSVVISLLTIIPSALMLTGFALPDGTVEQIYGAVQARDWMGLVSILALTVGNTLIRYLREKKRLADATA